MSKFVETVMKKTLVDVIDGDGPNNTFMSLKQSGKAINLVIGARYEDRWASWLGKESLQELINVLQEIHDAMEG